jgi:hypothetical protein
MFVAASPLACADPATCVGGENAAGRAWVSCMTSSTFTLSLLLAVALLAAVPWPSRAATAKPSAAAAAAAAAESPLGLCMAANKQALADLADGVAASKRKHVLNPMMVSRLQAFDGLIARLRAGLPKDAKSLPACEQTAQTLASEAERLQQLAGNDATDAAPRPSAAVEPPPPPAAAPPVAAASAPAPAPAEACPARASKAYNQLVRTLNDAGAMPNLATSLATKLQAMNDRMSTVYTALVGPALDAPACERLVAQIAGEQQELLRLLAPPAAARKPS